MNSEVLWQSCAFRSRKCVAVEEPPFTSPDRLQAVDIGSGGKAFCENSSMRGKEAELSPNVEDAALFVEEFVHGAPGDGPGSVASNSFQTESEGELMPEIPCHL